MQMEITHQKGSISIRKRLNSVILCGIMRTFCVVWKLVNFCLIVINAVHYCLSF